MKRLMHLALLVLALLAGQISSPSHAEGTGTGEGFVSRTVTVAGAKLHYMQGGKGPALILLHGFPEDWSQYQAIMPRLAKNYTVIVPDQRGIGKSKALSGGFDAATRADDIHQLAAKLGLKDIYLVGHDIGGHVAYAYLRKYSETLRGAMILDVPVAGVPGWDDVVNNPKIWHVGFMQTPGLAEKLIPGRQADFLGYFYALGRFTVTEKARFLKAYARPEQLHAAFEIYRAFPADEAFNTAHRERNDVPLLFATGEKSFLAGLAAKIAEGFRAAGFTRVEIAEIPDAQHYVVADNPDAVANLIERAAAR